MRATVLKTAAVAAFVFAASATAQDTTYAKVPFRVNVDAAITAVQGGNTVSMNVTGKTDGADTLKLPLEIKTASVQNTGRTQGRLNAPIITGSRGNITLRLPAQSYKNAEVALYSVNGKRILRGKAAASDAISGISRKNVSAGVYLLSVKGLDGNACTKRLTHSGGNMNINVAFGNENAPHDKPLAKQAAAGNWNITVSAVAAGYKDSTYTLNITVVQNTLQDIILTATLPSENLVCADGEAWVDDELEDEYMSGLIFRSNGDFIVIFSRDGNTWNVVEDETGKYTTSGNRFTAVANDPENDEITMTYSVSGNKLTVNGVGDEAGYFKTYTKKSGIYPIGLPAAPNAPTTFKDSRDNKTYRAIKIGNQNWMAENLNYDAESSVCYGNSAENCVKYGRLYDWNTAMNGALSSSSSPSGVQGVCPAGWHIPSDAEWTTLENAVGGQNTAGKKLKSTSGWYNNGNGTDEYKFSALPGGYGYNGGYFIDTGEYGSWWSATEFNNNRAMLRSVEYNNESVGWGDHDKTRQFSVRCVQD